MKQRIVGPLVALALLALTFPRHAQPDSSPLWEKLHARQHARLFTGTDSWAFVENLLLVAPAEGVDLEHALGATLLLHRNGNWAGKGPLLGVNKVLVEEIGKAGRARPEHTRSDPTRWSRAYELAVREQQLAIAREQGEDTAGEGLGRFLQGKVPGATLEEKLTTFLRERGFVSVVRREPARFTNVKLLLDCATPSIWYERPEAAPRLCVGYLVDGGKRFVLIADPRKAQPLALTRAHFSAQVKAHVVTVAHAEELRLGFGKGNELLLDRPLSSLTGAHESALEFVEWSDAGEVLFVGMPLTNPKMAQHFCEEMLAKEAALAARLAEVAAAQEPLAATSRSVTAIVHDRGFTPLEITYYANSIEMEFVLIPAGEYVMGSPEDEVNRYPRETQHRVKITMSFYLGAYEVTQEQYERVMGENPAKFKDPKKPVEGVTWYNAQEFCKRLSLLDGRKYRLPTEAEWEYACRAGSTTPYSTGKRITRGWANFTDRSSGREESLGGTVPVGSYPPNAWGLYDMMGNVQEYCADYWETKYYERSPLEDPPGPSGGDQIVLRGGHWSSSRRSMRSAWRNTEALSLQDTLHTQGFRVVCEAPQSPKGN